MRRIDSSRTYLSAQGTCGTAIQAVEDLRIRREAGIEAF
jgi:hypothetical protein